MKGSYIDWLKTRLTANSALVDYANNEQVEATFIKERNNFLRDNNVPDHIINSSSITNEQLNALFEMKLAVIAAEQERMAAEQERIAAEQEKLQARRDKEAAQLQSAQLGQEIQFHLAKAREEVEAIEAAGAELDRQKAARSLPPHARVNGGGNVRTVHRSGDYVRMVEEDRKSASCCVML